MHTFHRVLLLASVLLASTATFARSGGGLRADLAGPWKDGSYTVRTFMCGKDLPFAVNGWAEGVVNGQRRTVALKLHQRGHDPIYDFTRAWPAEGMWMIRLAAAKKNQLAATTVVAVDSEGRLGEAKYVWSSDGRHECDAQLAAK